MEYRRLGRSGLRIFPVVLGTMNFGGPTPREEAFRIIDRSLDRGVNFLDCADVYAGGESEKVVGQALRRDGKRDQVLVASKVFMPTGPGPNDRGNTRHHIFQACEGSLQRLQVDFLDVYLLHRTDFNVPQDETLAALGDLVQQGKVRAIGCSTHPPWRTVEAVWISRTYGYPAFTCEQPPYNLLDRRAETEILPMCRAYDLGVITWSPLAQGVLGGRYQSTNSFPAGSRATQKEIYAERVTTAGIEVAHQLAQHAERKGRTVSQFALAWILAQRGVTGAIIGPRTLAQTDDLLGALDADLDEDDHLYCDSLVSPGAFVSNHFNTAGWLPAAE